jgi:DNA-binding GntR family transcriptional regulator
MVFRSKNKDKSVKRGAVAMIDVEEVINADRTNLSSQIYARVKDGILSSEFPPGEILQERALAEKLGVSRTPVREALTRLSSEGWFVSNNRGQPQVKDITQHDVYELFQIRRMVETEAVTRIFEKGNSRSIVSSLSESIEKMKKQTADYLAFTKTDLYFHANLIAANENQRLLRIWLNMHEEITRCGMIAIKEEHRLEKVLQEHEEILEALWNQDKDACLGAILHHHNMSKKALVQGFIAKEKMQD